MFDRTRSPAGSERQVVNGVRKDVLGGKGELRAPWNAGNVVVRFVWRTACLEDLDRDGFGRGSKKSGTK